MNNITLTSLIRHTLAAVLLLMAATDMAAQDFKFSRTALDIDMTLTESEDVGRDYAVIVTPQLANAKGDTLDLKPVVFRNKRNKLYTQRGRRYGTIAPAVMQEYDLGQSVGYAANVSRKDAPWAWKGNVSVVLKREKEGCCNVAPLSPRPLAASALWDPPFKPAFKPQPINTGKGGELAKKYPMIRHISEYEPRPRKGALFVHFPLDKWDLIYNFRTNAERLDLTEEVTRAILADTTSDVKLIQIVGIASIEGPAKRNKMLAGNRAEALKRYVIDHVSGVTDSLFELINVGEGWDEFIDCVNEREFDGKQQVLDIINTEPDLNRREVKLKRLNGGRTYAYLLNNVLIDQRFSGYIRIYYDYVRDTAGEAINSAISLLSQQRYVEALPTLRQYAGDHRAWNALGVALYNTGNKAEAAEYLRRAAAQGDNDAKDNLHQLELE